jgi:hypothetical protein
LSAFTQSNGLNLNFFTFSNIQSKARDVKRKSDIASLAKALQAYNSENSAYPISPTAGVGDADSVATTPTLTNALSGYGGSIPKAPTYTFSSGVSGYRYVSHNTGGTTYDGTTFALCAQVEDTTAGTCGGSACMFKVTSEDLVGMYVPNATCAAK